MSCLLIASAKSSAGKTMLSAGLARRWTGNGQRTGYLRITSTEEREGAKTRDDVCFMESVINHGRGDQSENLAVELPETIREAYQRASKNNDIVIVEGLLSDIRKATEVLDGNILVVHDCALTNQDSLPLYCEIGKRLSGVIFNKVPRRNLKTQKETLQRQFVEAGLTVFGYMAEDRLLSTISIADLTAAVQGKMLNNEDKAGELIENIMLGSSTFDRGPAYYNRKKNKAVLVWGERAGFRQAAVANYPNFDLQTSTRCIVISHNATPLPAVAQKAAEQEVPLILSAATLPEIVQAVENIIIDLRFHHPAKLPHLMELMQEGIDFKSLEDLLRPQ